MKLKHPSRAAAALLAAAFLLAGCSGTASSTQDDSGASSAADSAAQDASSASSASSSSEGDDASDPYAYLADFSYSQVFDENGYLAGVTASDYVTLPEDYNAMQLSDEANTVTDASVESYIQENILANYQSTEQVTDRAAEMGDTVNIDFVGSVDGVEFEGGNSQNQGYTLVLGSNSFIDDFEDQIAGHTPGETFNVEVTFPDDYGAEGTDRAELNGKDAVFVTTLNYISALTTPELTDEWVQENLMTGEHFSDVATLQEYVRGIMLFNQQSDELYSNLLQNAAFTEDLPSEVVTYMQDYYLYGPYQYAAQYGVTLETFLQQVGYDDAQAYLDQAQAQVESSIRQMLLVQAVAEAEGLVCDDARMEAELAEIFGDQDSSAYTAQYGDGYVKMGFLHDMVMDKLIEGAA